MNNSSISKFPQTIILASIPLGLALLFLFQLVTSQLTLTITSGVMLFAFLASLSLYTVAVYFAGDIHEAGWMAYIHMGTHVAWMTIGIEAAIWIIILGSALAVALQNRFPITYYHKLKTPYSTPLENFLGRVSTSGLSVLVAQVLYSSIFGFTLPFKQIDTQQFFIIALVLLSSKFVSAATGYFITGKTVFEQAHSIKTNHALMMEVLLIPLIIITPLVLFQANILAFVVIIGFAISQVFRHYQATRIRIEFMIQVNELSTLNNLAKNISLNIDLNEVLQNIYQEVNKLVNATTIFIALYDNEEQLLDYKLVMTDNTTTTWQGRPLSEGMTDYVIRQQQPLHIRKSETERFKQLGINPTHVESQAYLGIPMMIGDKVLGVMGMLNRDEIDVMNGSNINVLQTIANQAGLALRNASLYDRTNKLAKNLSLINSSVQDVMFNLDHEEAMHAACLTAIEVTKAEKVAIFLIEMLDKPIIKLAQSIGLSPEFEKQIQNPPANLFISNIEGYRTVANINDLDDEHIKQLAEIGHFKAFAEIPLRSGNTIVGYMIIYHEQIHHYHSLEIDLMEMLTNQITVALDNSDLLQALELYASEQAQLVHLSSISTSSLELERVIMDVSHLLRQMLNVQTVQIGLYVSGRHRISVYHVQQADDTSYIDLQDFSLDDYSEFYITSQTMVGFPRILFASDEHVSSQSRQYMLERNYSTITIMPMIINGEVIGIIIIGDTEERLFKDNERRLLEMATTQIAAQIHNAQIHTLTEEALVQRLEQLSLIEDIGQQISRALDLDVIINNVLEAAMRSTQADITTLALIANDSQFRVKVQENRNGEIIRYDIERPINTGVISQVVKTGIMQVIPDNQAVRDYVPPSSATQYHSSLAVPLIKGDKVIGVLNVESVHPNFFTDEHAGFIKSLAGHAIISIDNASLLEERQYQIAVLTQLRELALSAITTESTFEVVNTVITTSMEMLKGNSGALYDYSSDQNELTPRTGLIRLGERYVEDHIFIPDSILYHAAHTEELVVIESVTNNERYRAYEHLQFVNYSSAVVLPIKRRNRVTELLCVTFKEPHIFGTSDYNSIDLLTFQVANHLENAILNEEIRTSNLRMRAILDSTRDGIILLDREGRLQDVNISAEELLGIDLSNHIDKNFATTLMNHSYPADNEESFEELIKTARILRTSPQRNMIREYTLNTHGHHFFIREVSSPVHDGNGNIVGRLLSLRDVTEERSLEDFRTKLQRMIVHDLKGPLSAVISSMILGLDILNESSDDIVIQTLTPIMEVSAESANNLMQLVESLLDIQKMQRKEMDLHAETATVKQLAENAYTTLMASFRQYDITIEYNIPDEFPSVFIDRHLIDRVIVNLLQNALKFTPSGKSIRISAQTESDRQDFICMMVSDDGPGIPEETRDKIFGEFIQIKDINHKQQRGSRGSGLGLTFCQLAVEAHGGRIWVAEESPLAGATFAFTLPVAPSPQI